MFTGLITDIGTIERFANTAAGREFRVRSVYAGVADGESIAVGGICLTVRERGEGWFSVAAVVTTADRTTVGDWQAGCRVNLERALVVGARMGGHLVQGHVDAVAEVAQVVLRHDTLLVDLFMPSHLMPLVVLHGSICVEGVSLTVNAIPDTQSVQLSIIEYTQRHTTLGALRAGDRVNIEADVLAKYVQRLLGSTLVAAPYSSTA